MTECSVDGCIGQVRARGWCSKHYQRWKARGAPDAEVRPVGCACCRHADTSEINAQITAGRPRLDIAADFGMTRRSVDRHAAYCLGLPVRPSGCATCRLENVSEVNARLVAGEIHEQVAASIGLSRAAVALHSRRCLGIIRNGCSICNHRQRREIETDALACRSLAAVATRWGVNPQAMQRHAGACMRLVPGATCCICDHPEVDLLEACLLAGAGAHGLAAAFDLPSSSLRWHMERHLAESYQADRAVASVSRLAAVRRIQTA